MSHEEGAAADLADFDLVIWDSRVPPAVLARVGKQQTLILLGGAGEDLSHYARYAERIALVATSFNYLDEPLTNLTRQHLAPTRLLSAQGYYVAKYARRFMRFAHPRFFREIGVPFMHLPFASDPEVFHPLPERRQSARWVFCGSMGGRTVIRELQRLSERRAWEFILIAPELGNTVEPTELNGIYNRAQVGVNEQHLMTFGRELNQRAFDYGMAGIPQLTDMGYMCAPMFGSYCSIYSGKLSNPSDGSYAAHLMERMAAPPPDEVHAFFAKNHSFAARLGVISVALGRDLCRGRVRLADYREAAYAWMTYRPSAPPVSSRAGPGDG